MTTNFHHFCKVFIKFSNLNADMSFREQLKFLTFFFYLGFLSCTFIIHRTAGEGGGYPFNSSVPLPPDYRTFRHHPGDYCRKITSTHSCQPDSNREPLVSTRKSLTIKLRARHLGP